MWLYRKSPQSQVSALRRVAVRDRDADNNGSLEERLYAAHNANWNISSILSTSAAVQERYVYDPFGAPSFKDATYGSRSSSSFVWAVLHQGGRQSGQSGLYQFRNRELSAGLGVWTSQDRLGLSAGDNNLRRYVHNSPASSTDPWGLFTCRCECSCISRRVGLASGVSAAVMDWYDWIPFVGTIANACKTPKGGVFVDYVHCIVTPRDIQRLGRDSAIQKCEQCIDAAFMRFVVAYAGPGACFIGIEGGVGGVAIKAGTRALIPIAGGLLVVDGLCNSAITVSKISEMQEAAEKAKKAYCK
jgi:RHS repeat-associated protein